jgi:hypothetical protein
MPTTLLSTAPAVEELFGERERREDSQAQKPCTRQSLYTLSLNCRTRQLVLVIRSTIDPRWLLLASTK